MLDFNNIYINEINIILKHVIGVCRYQLFRICMGGGIITLSKYVPHYNAFNVYRRELAPGTVSLTGDRAKGDDSKHWAYSSGI